MIRVMLAEIVMLIELVKLVELVELVILVMLVVPVEMKHHVCVLFPHYLQHENG